MGIGVRARALAAAAPAERSGIAGDLARLTDAMGQSFKVMAITAAGAPPPAGFDGLAEGVS